MLVLGVAVPAAARVDQATQRAVNQAQVAMDQGEGDAVYQAIDQAQNTRKVVEQSPLENRDSTPVSEARFLVGAVALLAAGVLLVYTIRGWRRKNRNFSGLGLYYRRRRLPDWHEQAPSASSRSVGERGNESEERAESSGDYLGSDTDLSIGCPSSSCQR